MKKTLNIHMAIIIMIIIVMIMNKRMNILKTFSISSDTEKCFVEEVEEDKEDIFSSIIKKFKKADKTDPEVNLKIADMINEMFIRDARWHL